MNFDGCGEEAFRFYERVFRTEIKSFFRVKDAPNKNDFKQELQDAVVWTEMELGNISLYGEDLQLFSRTGSMPLPNRNQYPNQFISLEMSDKEENDRIFSELSEGGTIVFPLSKTFSSEHYGRVVDKYRVGWKLMV